MGKCKLDLRDQAQNPNSLLPPRVITLFTPQEIYSVGSFMPLHVFVGELFNRDTALAWYNLINSFLIIRSSAALYAESSYLHGMI